MAARIEICGGIASGKTTLSGLLAHRRRYVSIKEDFRSNPFWRLFYAKPKIYGFETEVTFLLQHYSQIKSFEDRKRIAVCDFSLLQDDAYARTNLVEGQLHTFLRVFEYVAEASGAPNLLVHLECDAATELARIRRRRRSVESDISLRYLLNLNAMIARRVAQARVKGVNVLRIDSAQNNFAHNAETREHIMAVVAKAIR